MKVNSKKDISKKDISKKVNSKKVNNETLFSHYSHINPLSCSWD